MSNESRSRTLIYLFSAIVACHYACQRTREMVKRAIARYLDLVAGA